MQKNSVNNWDDSAVKRAESTWGDDYPPYVKNMFDFALQGGKSYLDLGCGFGRFFSYAVDNFGDFNYIGYDSSISMLNRLREKYPDYELCFIERNITETFLHCQQSVLSSAVFIHLTIEDQRKILSNIYSIKPLSIVFDINCPTEIEIANLEAQNLESYERFIFAGSESGGFRMTWQSHGKTTQYLLQNFREYNLTVEFYDLKLGRHKVVYYLTRKD
jgi:SAM-dependent methyltransferase